MKPCRMAGAALLAALLVGCGQSSPAPMQVVAVELIDVADLDSPISLKPVVQFSCAQVTTPAEDAWEADLRGADAEARLAALGKLIELSAPSSVPLQYQAFLDLKGGYADQGSVKSAAQAFDEARIIQVISRTPPREEYASDDTEFYWCLRAVGVLKMAACIPRLVELSDVDNLYTTLAAERSLEDFDGEAAEDALLRVVSFGRYDAFVRAADEMLRRNPARLARGLETMSFPERHGYQYGLFLARCGNPKAVPILCETVKNIAMVDGEMFKHIAALGRPSDRAIILALPGQVRAEQTEQAQACVEKYLERMQGLSDEPEAGTGGR